MLIDTHCHLNIMVTPTFDTLLTDHQVKSVEPIVDKAIESGVTTIINVGTSLTESINCITLAQQYSQVWATVGIHPNDCTSTWRQDLAQLKTYLNKSHTYKIVGIGEVGLDKHYPGYNLQRQKDALKAQINMALAYDLALVIHTRDAADETLESLQEFKDDIKRGIIHCFSEDASFAQTVLDWGFVLGIGGIITYPKNNVLREIVRTIDLSSIVLETDAPFLPIQTMRGKQNAPHYIRQIAEYIAELRNEPFEDVAGTTTKTARNIFKI